MARVLLCKARFSENSGDNCVPPLGIMYIASALREAGHEPRIFDVGEREHDLEPLRRLLRSFRPQVIGLSAITIEAVSMERMATVCRATLPDVPIIVGGPHATAYPERCAHHPAIDYVVRGEGERTAVELINALTRGGADVSSVRGLTYESDAGELVDTGDQPAIEDVDRLPFPAWDLVDIDYYEKRPSMANMGRRRYMVIFTSRGCPFKCIYCHEVQGKRFRARSPANVLAEIRMLRDRHGINDFEIIDDIFNFDRDRMIEILGRVERLEPRPRLHFPNGLRTDILDERQLLALRSAGTTSLAVAVETASPRLQKLTKKYLKVEKVRQNIEIADRLGLYVRGFFMLGFPTETLAEAESTVQLAVDSRLHQALFFIVTPFAGTTLYELYQEIIRKRGLELDSGEDFSYVQANYNLSAMEDQQLFDLQRSAFRRFYLDPRRVGRILARHPQKQGLLLHGLQLLRAVTQHRPDEGTHEQAALA